jgi:uncharacterized protein
MLPSRLATTGRHDPTRKPHPVQLDPDQGKGNVIRSFSGGEVHVADGTFREPLIVTADRIITDWSPPAFEALTPADFERVLALEPEVILLGTGAGQRFLPAAVTHAILTRGVGLEVMSTAAACRTFNVLASEYRRVVAALYIV